MSSLPQQKPGTEAPKKLTDLEYANIRNHFLRKSLQEAQSVIHSKEKEILVLKQQICDLSKEVLVMRQGKEEMAKDSSDKAVVNLQNEYENTTQKDIKERLGIPLNKGFSYDPDTLKVTVNE